MALYFLQRPVPTSVSVYLHGTGRVNQERVARELGLSPAKLSRVVTGAGPGAQIGVNELEALRAWCGAPDLGSLLDSMENSPPAPHGAYKGYP